MVEILVPFERGKLTPIKNVLEYPRFFSLVLLPSSVAMKLEAIQRNILRGSFRSDFTHHLVRWTIVKQHVIHGGLGVRDLCDSLMKLF